MCNLVDVVTVRKIQTQANLSLRFGHFVHADSMQGWAAVQMQLAKADQICTFAVWHDAVNADAHCTFSKSEEREEYSQYGNSVVFQQSPELMGKAAIVMEEQLTSRNAIRLTTITLFILSRFYCELPVIT